MGEIKIIDTFDVTLDLSSEAQDEISNAITQAISKRLEVLGLTIEALENYHYTLNTLTIPVSLDIKKHQCERDKLIWNTTPNFEGECVAFKGKCPTCGRVYERVFTENDGLWDVEKEEYVYI